MLIHDSPENASVRTLKAVQVKNLYLITIAHLNVNSFKNKFGFLTDQIKDSIDVSVISKIKLNSSFPRGQVRTQGFTTPFWRDPGQFCGGIWCF